METLKILYACVRCRRIYYGDGYDLRAMFGRPIVCADCRGGK